MSLHHIVIGYTEGDKNNASWIISWFPDDKTINKHFYHTDIIEIREDLEIVNGEILLPFISKIIKMETLMEYFKTNLMKMELYSVYEWDTISGYHLILNDKQNLWIFHENYCIMCIDYLGD